MHVATNLLQHEIETEWSTILLFPLKSLSSVL